MRKSDSIGYRLAETLDSIPISGRKKIKKATCSAVIERTGEQEYSFTLATETEKQDFEKLDLRTACIMTLAVMVLA